jgi:2-keto-4-pentenoate hydratase/2-oxohepta-3-ene-1,7-dioic acid hydratase in catechol pathway
MRLTRPESLLAARGGSGLDFAPCVFLTLLGFADVEKQRGTTGDMVFGIPELIEACSRMHTLEEGDLILTGTPAGVGPVQNGDIIRGGIAELGEEMVFEVE